MVTPRFCVRVPPLLKATWVPLGMLSQAVLAGRSAPANPVSAQLAGAHVTGPTEPHDGPSNEKLETGIEYNGFAKPRLPNRKTATDNPERTRFRFPTSH